MIAIRLISAGCFVVFALVGLCMGQPASAAKIWEGVRAKYGSLNSYSDTGTVTNEFGTNSKETHKFTTLFSRVPRGYLLDFTKESGERFVIWGDPDSFHNWWSAINSKSDYPNPNNTGAFTGADVHTLGAAMKVTALLYPKANFQGSFTNFAEQVLAGTNDVSGHKCYRLTGSARDIYGNTGRETSVRTMNVWIDIDSMLIRKVVEEWPPLPGQVSRYTTVYEPLANPAIDKSKFIFAPPH